MPQLCKLVDVLLVFVAVYAASGHRASQKAVAAYSSGQMQEQSNLVVQQISEYNELLVEEVRMLEKQLQKSKQLLAEAAAQKALVQGSTEGTNIANWLHDTNHSFSLAEKDLEGTVDPFAAYANPPYSCCCKILDANETASMCLTGKDKQRKSAFAVVSKGGTRKTICCKSRQSRFYKTCDMVSGYTKPVIEFTVAHGHGFEVDKHSCKTKGVQLQRQNAFRCSRGLNCTTDEVDECDADSVSGFWCKATIKTKCFLGRVVSGAVPGVANSGAGSNCVKAAIYDFELLENSAQKTAGFAAAGQVILANVAVGTSMNILKLAALACHHKVNTCAGGVTTFKIAIGITAITMALTLVPGVGLTIAFVVMALGSGLVAQIAGDICKLGGIMPTLKHYFGGGYEFLENAWKTMFKTKSKTKAFVAAVLSGGAKLILKLLTFVCNFVKGLLLALVKMVKTVIFLIPNLIKTAYDAVTGENKSKKKQKARAAATKGICCAIKSLGGQRGELARLQGEAQKEEAVSEPKKEKELQKWSTVGKDVATLGKCLNVFNWR